MRELDTELLIEAAAAYRLAAESLSQIRREWGDSANGPMQNLGAYWHECGFLLEQIARKILVAVAKSELPHPIYDVEWKAIFRVEKFGFPQAVKAMSDVYDKMKTKGFQQNEHLLYI